MIKYSISYRGHDDVAWRIDIELPNYTTPVIYELRGVSEQACVITYSGETDEPYSPIAYSSAVLNLYSSPDLDVKELQKLEDKEARVYVYRAGNIYWTGYLIADGIQRSMKSIDTVTLSATDGLSLLESMEYYHANLPGTTSTNIRSPLNYIRQILFSPYNLGIAMPIRWTNDLECTAFPGKDVFTGGVEWSPRGEGFNSFQVGTDGQPIKRQNCLWILEGILRSFQCRLVQAAGKWRIRRINDIVSGISTYKEIPGTLGTMVITSGSADYLLRTIGLSGYPFIRNDHVITVKKAAKTVKTTYKATHRENVLPNGNLDVVSSGGLMYWRVVGGNGEYLEAVPGIVAQSTGAGKITFPYIPDGPLGPSVSQFFIASSVFPYGFVTMPIDTRLYKKMRFGFSFLPQNGFAYNTTTGFIDWTDNPLSVAISFNDGANVWSMNEFGIWSNTGLITPIHPTVEAMKLGDVATIDFNKHGDIVFPKIVNPDSTNLGLYLTFQIRAGQIVTFDNIYISVEDNDEVFEATYNNPDGSATRNTNTDEVELTISSGITGFLVSSYMGGWDVADDHRKFTDGAFYTGNLTGLNSQAMMRFRYKPSDIFNGSINVRNAAWSFDEIYEIDSLTGEKFIPLNADYNTETAEVKLVAMECRNDTISLTEKRYGTNDTQLSN